MIFKVLKSMGGILPYQHVCHQRQLPVPFPNHALRPSGTRSNSIRQHNP